MIAVFCILSKINALSRQQQNSIMMKDTIFAAPIEKLGDFYFWWKRGGSFPRYDSTLDSGLLQHYHAIGMLAERFVTADSQVYDLGVHAVRQPFLCAVILNNQCEIIGVW